MTGYGRKEVRGEGGVVTIEVRSLNSRFLDIQTRTPKSLAFLEQGIRKSIQERFSRGRFEVFVARNGDDRKTARLMLDEEKARQYIDVLSQLKERFSLPGEVSLSLLAGVPDLVTAADTQEDVEKVWSMISEALQEACSELEAMRAEEGKALERDMRERMKTIQKLMEDVRNRSPRSLDEARTRLTEAVNRLLPEIPRGVQEVDPARIAQEIALLAERTDVSEEITRLDSHRGQFLGLMEQKGNDAVGRKLDFLLQEMNREVNTIASKAQDSAISMNVVKLKAELEKVREQVQNVE